MTRLNCLIVSEDIVFQEVIHRLLCYEIDDVNIISIRSFAKLKELPEHMKEDIIILDDSISGTAHYEVIAYLRIVKDIEAPIYFFSPADYIEEQAYVNGVSHFFKKPFDPKSIIDHIISTIQSIKKE